MPATLGHLGVQALITRSVLRGADVKWIWLGCVVPDLPWILQRFLKFLDVSPYDLRLHAIIQSSLLFCVVASALFALFSRSFGRAFGILVGSAALHLLIDALQIKWANGVVLFGPVDWTVWNLGFFWPEDLATYALYLIGVGYVAFAAWKLPAETQDLCWPRGFRLAAFGALVAAYMAGPILWLEQAARVDPHYASTLCERDARDGKPIEFDRARTVGSADTVMLATWPGETFQLAGTPLPSGQIVSIRGRFEGPDVIRVDDVHLHRGRWRDYASYLGLLIVLLWWGRCLIALRHRI